MNDAQSVAVTMLRLRNALPSTWVPDNSTVLLLNRLNLEIPLALADHVTVRRYGSRRLAAYRAKCSAELSNDVGSGVGHRQEVLS